VQEEPQVQHRPARQHLGRRVKNAFQTYPTWQFEWVYEFLRDDNVANGYIYSDLRVLQGFFMQLAGATGTSCSTTRTTITCSAARSRPPTG
jgi:hypothetical protein